ncbi:MAG: hypothetical protein WCO52_00230 [bacterium]
MNAVQKLKAAAAVALMVVYGIARNTFHPVLTQQVALGQLQDRPSSFTDYRLWETAWSYGSIAVVLIVLALFWPEIKSVFGAAKKAVADEVQEDSV